MQCVANTDVRVVIEEVAVVMLGIRPTWTISVNVKEIKFLPLGSMSVRKIDYLISE